MPNEIYEKTYAVFADSANRKLVGDLENAGERVLQFSPIESEKISLDESSIEYLKKLSGFDWLIFSDVLAVDYFLENLEERGIDFYEMDLLRVCAVGEAVADQLRFASVHADVIAASVETEIVFSALENYVGKENSSGLKILFPKQFGGENSLPEKLRDNGAEVIELLVYRIKTANKIAMTKLKTLLKGGAIDEFIFASPVDFIALRYYFEPENFANFFSEIKVSATNGAAFQTARENNFKAVGLFHFDKLGKVKT
ncbi:MAG: uroporphyrinogen-III synthase [Pyrinomonadaceae bacterium]